MRARARIPIPGPSYLREDVLRLGPLGAETGEPRTIRLGMLPPSTEDDWWLAILWAADEEGVLEAREIAPASGPPAGPPLLVMGPAFSGALSGLVGQVEGRQALRLRLPPAADEARPWDRPLLLQVALLWDPVRAATMTGNELAREVLRAFGQAIRAAADAR